MSYQGARIVILQSENNSLKQDLAGFKIELENAESTIDDLKLTLDITQSQLKRYQQIEMNLLARRRQIALVQHRAEYIRKRNQTSNVPMAIEAESDGVHMSDIHMIDNDNDDNKDDDYDIID